MHKYPHPTPQSVFWMRLHCILLICQFVIFLCFIWIIILIYPDELVPCYTRNCLTIRNTWVHFGVLMGSCCSILSFLCSVLLVRFHLTIVLSVLLLNVDSNYHFGIFNSSFHRQKHWSTRYIVLIQRQLVFALYLYVATASLDKKQQITIL